MKLKKRIAAMGAAAVMAVSMMSIGASAYNVSKTGLANFEWYTSSAMIKNNSNTSRYMETHIDVYRDNTGEYVTTLSATAAGGYGTYAKKQIIIVRAAITLLCGEIFIIALLQCLDLPGAPVTSI